MLTVALVVAAVLLAGLVVASPEQTRPRIAMLAGFVVLTFLPVRSAPHDALLVAYGVLILVNIIVLLSVRTERRTSTTTFLLVTLIVWMALINAATGSLSSTFIYFVAAATIAFPAARMRVTDVTWLCGWLIPLMLFHLGYALMELFAGRKAIWPTATGDNDISTRVNEIFPELVGRPMTSFGHPILLAFFFLVCFAFFVYQSTVQRRFLWWGFALVAFGGILLSGTRSAVLAAVAIFIVYAILRFNFRRIFGYIALVVVVGITLLLTPPEILFNELGIGSRFGESPSYLHRSLVSASFPGLFTQQDLGDVLFGWGDNTVAIFASGVVQRYSSSFSFFDNQYVATMAMYGVIGLLLLVSLSLVVLLRGGLLTRLLIVLFLFMSFSFDTLTHPLGVAVLAISAGLTSAVGGGRLLMVSADPIAEASGSDSISAALRLR